MSYEFLDADMSQPESRAELREVIDYLSAFSADAAITFTDHDVYKKWVEEDPTSAGLMMSEWMASPEPAHRINALMHVSALVDADPSIVINICTRGLDDEDPAVVKAAEEEWYFMIEDGGEGGQDADKLYSFLGLHGTVRLLRQFKEIGFLERMKQERAERKIAAE